MNKYKFMKEFKDLLYHKWISDFKKAIALPEGTNYYCNSSLVFKHDLYLLYLRQEAKKKVVPGYLKIYKNFEVNYPFIMRDINNPSFNNYAYYMDNPYTFIVELLYDLIVYWVLFPHYLTKIYLLLKEINVLMDEVEFIYLDFWLKVPKVIDDLLDHLLFLNIPIDKPILSDNPLIHYLDVVQPPLTDGNNDTFFNKFMHCGVFYGNTVLYDAFYCWLEHRPTLFQELKKFYDVYNFSDKPLMSDIRIKEFFVLNFIAFPCFDHNKLSNYTWAFLAANIPFRDPFSSFCESAVIEYNSWPASLKEEIYQNILAKYNRSKLALYEQEGIKFD